MTAVAAALAAGAVASGLVLAGLGQGVAFFVTPSEARAGTVPVDRRLRLGGMVETGSVERLGTLIRFRVTDTAVAVPVTYRGLLPDLFREGQGVVVEGRLAPDGSFAADTVLARHDETYMPPEAAAAVDRVEAMKRAARTVAE